MLAAPMTLPSCEKRATAKGSACGRPSTVFAMGQSYCAAHAPKGAEHCSHSLGIGRCAYCGAPL
jgi:hypothetical protein